MMKFVLSLALVALFSQADAGTDRVVCYYGSWANYRQGNGKFQVGQFDPTLCTHGVYTFLGIDETGVVKTLDSWLDVDLKNLENFVALKQRNPNFKAIIAVGGWNEGSPKYSAVARDASKRATMIQSALAIIQQYGFDGFDLDWEYPTQRGGEPDDKANFATLIKEFRQEFDKHGLILSAAVSAGFKTIEAAYDVPALNQYLDYINVMTYDFHGLWDGKTGHNSPLYPSVDDTTEDQKKFTVDGAIKEWLSLGASASKLNLGMGTYGHTFALADANKHGVGDTTYGGGEGGPYTQQQGTLGYNEICEFYKDSEWPEQWDEQSQVPYKFKGMEWISYDNPRSIDLKVQYAKQNGLGGVMIWSIETDDFSNVCGGGAYPLLNQIKKSL